MGHKVTIPRIESEKRSIEPKQSGSKPKRLYTIGAAFVAILLLFTSINILISATSPNIPTVIEPGSMVGQASYIVFKDGMTYYAKNGTTGNIDINGASPSYVINAAINGTGSAGGKIILKSGDYTFSTAGIVVQRSNIVIEGELQGFDWATSWSTRLIHAFDGTLIDVNGTVSARVWSPVLRNLVLWDDNWLYTGYGINIDKTSMPIVDNVRIERFQSGGIFCKDSWGPLIQNSIIGACGNNVTGAAGIRFNGSFATGDLCTVPILRTVLFEPGSTSGPDLYAFGIPDNIVLDNWFTEQLDGAPASTRFIFEETGGVVFTNGVCWNVQGTVLEVQGYVRSVKATNNRLFDLEGTGFSLAGAETSFVSGNTISGAGCIPNSVGIIASGHGEIIGNYVANMSGPGIDLPNPLTSAIGNTLVGNGYNPTGVSYYANKGLTVRDDNCTITANVFYVHSLSASQKVCVELNSDADNCTVTGNIFNDATWPVNNSGKNNIVSNNIGFTTENSGFAPVTGAVNTVTVNHSLSATPTVVIVTVNNTSAGNYSVSSITLTQFVISFTNQPGANTWLFYWYAKV